MADEVKQPESSAPGAQAPTAAAAAPPRTSARARAEEAESFRLQELAAQQNRRDLFDEVLRLHLHDANQLERNSTEPPHPTVYEHAELRGFKMVLVRDLDMKPVARPCWQMQALVARFHAHGLRHDARISHEYFERALDEALNGPV